VWATFLYLGVRTRRSSWLVWSAGYFVGVVGGFAANVAGHDDGGVWGVVSICLIAGTWLVGGAHIWLIRRDARAALASS
jgi:hypothetical protein